MIEVYLPFLLVIMSWNSSDPGGTMHVETRLFIDQQTCMSAGRELDGMMATVEESENRAYSWRCIEHVREIEIFRPDPAGQ